MTSDRANTRQQELIRLELARIARLKLRFHNGQLVGGRDRREDRPDPLWLARLQRRVLQED